MPALPTPGSDIGVWGTELNDFLSVSLSADGTLKSPSVPLGGGTMTGLLTVGSGDAVTMYNATTAQRLAAKIGTAASPNTTASPLVKAERTMQVVHTDFSGDGVENCSAVVGIGSGTATNDGQVVGVSGLAKSASTTVASSGGDDACGVYGAGRITGSGTGVGIGGFFNGRRDTNTGKANGIEVSVDNETATADSYLSTAFSNTTGIWLHATGTARSAVGLAFGNPFAAQFDVGIGFTSQGTGGPILTTTIRDDSSSVTSLAINGTHTTAIAVASAAGKVLVGRTTDGGLTTDVLMQSTVDTNSALQLMAHSGSQSTNIFSVLSSGGTELFSVGSTGNIRLIDHDFVFGTTTGTKFGTSTTQKLAFWNKTPVAQPSAYSTTNVTSDRTFDANATSIDEIADVLGTLISDLQTVGLVG